MSDGAVFVWGNGDNGLGIAGLEVGSLSPLFQDAVRTMKVGGGSGRGVGSDSSSGAVSLEGGEGGAVLEKNIGYNDVGMAVDDARLSVCPTPSLLPFGDCVSVIGAACGAGHTLLHIVNVSAEPRPAGLDYSAWCDPLGSYTRPGAPSRSTGAFRAQVQPCADEVDEVFTCCRHNKPKTLASILEGEFPVDFRFVSRAVEMHTVLIYPQR